MTDLPKCTFIGCPKMSDRHACFTPLDARQGEYTAFSMNGWYCSEHAELSLLDLIDETRAEKSRLRKAERKRRELG